MEAMPLESISVIMKSLNYAATRHRNQFRKGEEKTPYVNHLIGVANLLVNEAGETDTVLLSAAILHDVIEDTVESAEERAELIAEIREIFGDDILSVTLEVTDDKTLDKPERKRLQIEHAHLKSVRAKKLKIADKITNIRDIISFPPAGWDIQRIRAYIIWSEQVVMGCKGVNGRLEKIFSSEIARAKEIYRMN